MISDYLQRLILELGLTTEYIEEKVEETLAVAKLKGINLSLPALVGFDMNGPLTATNDATLFPLTIVQRGILALRGEKIKRVLISGWDLTSLKHFRNRRLGIETIGLIGELGATWEYDGKTIEFNPIPAEKHFLMKQGFFLGAANHNLKIALQGNISSRVADFYFEADGPSRGNTKNHFLVKNHEAKIVDIYQALQKDGGFNFSEADNAIIFEPSTTNIRSLDFVLGKVFTLQSVRLDMVNGKIYLWRDETDREDFSLRQMEEYARSFSPSEWKIEANQDHSVDIIYQGDGIRLNKETTANNMAENLFGSNNYIITNVGDRKSDVFTGQNTIFFAQYGTPASKHCKENRIPFIQVLHGGDYALILAALYGID